MHEAPRRMSKSTRRALKRADALHADCVRDINLASEWGFTEGRPTLVAPGGGGLDRNLFHRGDAGQGQLRLELSEMMESIPADFQLVINPRGFRAYVRNDTFFRSIPLVLREQPRTIFLAPNMRGEPQASQWLSRLGIGDSVRLLPMLSPSEMAFFFQQSQVLVSPSEHDGTPNSFLEAIACGCFPVVGDLESLREWIHDGVNGFLIDPGDPEALASAVIMALDDSELRTQAAGHNEKVIDERAERSKVGKQLDRFYREVAQP